MKKIKRKAGRRQINPTRIIAVTFAVIILIGTVLLSLPTASRSGQSHGVVTALFTATSSTCVTGLVMGDTWTMWSGFGQIVILSLIEIGGLGFMSAASLVVFLFRRKVGLRQRMLMAQALSVDDMQSVVKLQRWVLIGSLSIQFCGALILFFRFLPDYGWVQAAKWGVFHAVSAFCNAGFDIFGSVAEGASAGAFYGDWIVLMTLMGLVLLGGLGFFVWEEVIRVRKFKRFSVYTKLVLIFSFVLLFGGAAAFALLEWNNPATLGPMATDAKILNSLFQSVTLRTAGFVSIDQGGLTPAAKGVSLVLMLIGGCSGSTAGGMKVVTFVVLMLFLAARLRGRSRVTVFKRNIPREKVLDAATITMVMIGLALMGALLICITSPVEFTDALFETVSALATVGVTAGVTGKLTLIGKLLIILYMYFGRVGILTLSLGFLLGDRAEERFQYANTNLLIG